MSFQRGKYGVEYNTRPIRDDSSGIGWVFAVLGVVALVSLAITLIGRFRSSDDGDGAAVEALQSPPPSLPVSAPPPAVVPPAQDKTLIERAALPKRPPKVRNLLMRLEEAERCLRKTADAAEKIRYLEMALTTIEQLRALPGSPAADIDDALARRLGTLNTVRLFDLKSPQWVSEVTVKGGSSASRIAAEHGSTLASLIRLNGGKPLDKLVVGQKLRVLNHPRFNLVVHRRTRTADLSLNGKFFKRYDLIAPVKGRDGAYEIPAPARQLWTQIGVGFSVKDRNEIETLMPKGASVLISEF
jgi:LysM repeat protein